MLWGRDNVITWHADADYAIAHGAKHVMGPNEPDINDGIQAGMSPEECAAIWTKYIVPYKAKGIKLISPAFSNAPYPMGMNWMTQFLPLVAVKPDIISVHW